MSTTNKALANAILDPVEPIQHALPRLHVGDVLPEFADGALTHDGLQSHPGVCKAALLADLHSLGLVLLGGRLSAPLRGATVARRPGRGRGRSEGFDVSPSRGTPLAHLPHRASANTPERQHTLAHARTCAHTCTSALAATAALAQLEKVRA
eukprot:CAMPEP_0183545854 /NCGR_PEP_ID=MMETSP0371-20130417/51876_1 /TAXON_ID=268820 /ORGANISM="Peridinium aciculiferum, Strain PAER-2" /LENGTH=151 /DNA_ID=CAMNT_0025748175 /DNA_START=322 /DNA_END=774 /DNA_ORIENTATION=-